MDKSCKDKKMLSKHPENIEQGNRKTQIYTITSADFGIHFSLEIDCPCAIPA